MAVWRPKKLSKRVSFADPLVSYLGEHKPPSDPLSLLVNSPFDAVAESDWIDPMGDEMLSCSKLPADAPTKEQRIRDLLEGAIGWLQVHSPRGASNLEGESTPHNQLHIATSVTKQVCNPDPSPTALNNSSTEVTDNSLPTELFPERNNTVPLEQIH
jgi:hypothetical protein